MTPTLDQSYWAKESAVYWEPHPRLRFMARILAKLPQRRILDLGCSGAALRELLPSSFTYFGCDIADEAGRRLPAGHFLLRDFNESVDLAYFAGKGIDAIHIGGVLEYLHEPGRLLLEARNLVAAGAPLLLSIINFGSDHYTRAGTQHPGWVYRPGLEAFLRLLGDAGWAVDRLWPFIDKRGWKQMWFRGWAKLLGARHPWTRRRARQFILLARAA